MTTLALALLRTLPGWPVGDQPTFAAYLWMLVGIPLIAFVVIGLVAAMGALKKDAHAADIGHGVVARDEPGTGATAVDATAIEADATPRRAAVESGTH